MMNKIFGVKNITHLLYGFLICMPMLSILARTCYVAVNKNAKDSYSNKYVDKAITLTDSNKNDVYLQNTIWTYTDIGLTYGSQSSIYGFSNINLDLNELLETENINYVGFRFYTSQAGFIMFFDSTGYERRIANYRQYFTSFTYTVDLTYYSSLPNPTSYGRFTSITYTNQSLDNAFEYSLSEFTKDNNLGNVDLFSWFTNLFLDQTNPTNQLYLGFVNWYLNYTLLVSSGYLLFLTLIWFVNYVRRILDKSMNQEYGGF